MNVYTSKVFYFRHEISNSEEEKFQKVIHSYSLSFVPSLKYKLNLNRNPFPIVEPSAGAKLEEVFYFVSHVFMKPSALPRSLG